jgi:hypothetical protein
MSLAKRFQQDIAWEYSLIDRMRVRGHVMNMQNVCMLRMFFQQCRGVNWIEPRHLQQITQDFVQHVEASRKNTRFLRLDGMTRYVITPKGMVQGTAIIKLTECLNGTIGESESSSPKVASPQTELQKGYRRVRSALEQLLEHVGLRAA